jgi:hypothetical protein
MRHSTLGGLDVYGTSEIGSRYVQPILSPRRLLEYFHVGDGVNQGCDKAPSIWANCAARMGL